MGSLVTSQYANEGNSSTVENVVDCDMLYETERVGPIGNFKKVEVDTDNETKEESAEMFDDDEHILEDVPVSMNNFNFNPDPKHDLRITVVEVYEHDLDVIDYESFGSDLDDGIDSDRRTQLRELKRIDRSQILMTVGVDANKRIYPLAFAIVEAESKASWCWFLNLLGEDLGLIQAIASVFPSAEHRYHVKHIHENMKSQFKGGRAKCDLLLNNIYEVFNRQLVDGRDQPIITCKEYIREYLMKRIVVVQKVIAKTVGPLTYTVTGIFDVIKKIATDYIVDWNGVGIPKNWVHAAYRLKTWAHVYSFKINPCNGRELWPLVESKTVIIPPIYKPQVGRPPMKMKKKGCKGQGGASQAGGSSQQSQGARQAAGARNVSSQAAGSSQQSQAPRQAASVRNASSQAASSSQPSAAPSQASQGPSQHSARPTQASQGPIQGFQAPRPTPSSEPQRLTKKSASRHSQVKPPF
ncbi:hypothetical protein Tco_0739232 [Tanacetum coccineum]